MVGRNLVFGTVALATAVSVAAAQHPSVLAGVQPGLWEISGAPGTRTPVRQCVASIVSLAEFEHRGKPCTLRPISESGSTALFDYSCGAAGFGRSQIDVVTPRSLRIDTQGISDQLPFHYVIQARRIANCREH